MYAVKKQVICINWGTKYGPRYINRLYGMVARNITPPFSFTCFTDNDQGIRPEVICEPLPPIDAEMPVGSRGKWPKSRLWGDRLGDLSGPVLFLDLDIVITGSIDDFFSYGDPDQVILARNPTRPLERMGQTSVFRFPVGKLVPLQDRFRANPQAIADEFEWEQRFVTRNAPGGVGLFPRAWVRHFRHHCMHPFPLNLALTPRLPAGAKIVIFPGGFHPEHAIAGGWKKRRKGLSLRENLKAATLQKDMWKRLEVLRQYCKTTGWVSDHWRE